MLNVTIESSTEKKRNTGKEHRALYTELLEANQSAQYWLWDTAEEFETKKNRIYYYPNAGKLVVRLPMYRNKLGALYEKDFIKAMMYAREINEDTLIRIDITSAVAYDIITDGLSKHFKGIEDYSTGLPYIGMPEDDIDLTCLGKSDWRVGWHTIEVDGREVRARAHDYYNKHKQYIFTVWCAGNKVIAIEDHTAEPLDQNPYIPETPKPTYKLTPKSTPAPTGGWYDPGKMTYDFYGGDPYDASDYSNPDDFYDDHYDDFFNYDEAEEYWIEHEYDD